MDTTTPDPRRHPHPAAPGTLRQQLQAVGVYLSDPWRCRDRANRWRMARRTVMQHARRPT